MAKATSDHWAGITAPSLADVDAIAREQLNFIPEHLRQRLGAIIMRVDDFPDEALCQEMNLDSPYDLLGLYSGVPLDQKSVADSPLSPDMIFLYRRPLLDYWIESGASLTEVIRETLVHEVGHHFGLSDEDMHALEQEVMHD